MNNTMENLNFFYEMCMKEYEKSILNLTAYHQMIKEIHESVALIDSDHATFLTLYDQALVNFSLISDVIRKFNIQVELTACKLKQLQPQVTHTSSISLNKSADQTTIVEKDPFVYPPNDFSSYYIGYESDCAITYVKNAEKKIFYIIDLKSKVYLSCALGMGKYFDEKREKFTTLPKPGVVFGYYIDGYMFRGVCQTQYDNDSTKELKVYLIDVGEVVTCTSANYALYVLPEAYQSIPAQAFLCKLEKLYDPANSDPEIFLKKNKYVKQKFRIVNIENDTLHVKLYPFDKIQTNPFYDKTMMSTTSSTSSTDTDKNNGEYPVTNPFRQFRCVIKKTNNNSNSSSGDTANFQLTSDTNRNITNEDTKSSHSMNAMCADFSRDLKIKNNTTPMAMVPYSASDYFYSYGSDVNSDFKPTNQFYKNSRKFELPKTPAIQNMPMNNYMKPAATIMPEKPPIIYNYNNIQPMYPVLPANNYFIEKPPVMYAKSNGNSELPNNCKNFKQLSHENQSYSLSAIEKPLSMAAGQTPHNQSTIAYDKLSAEQMKILYDEPLNTENAMVAVMGYDPKDDERICKFYDPSINGCFKGAHCNKEHVAKLADGWTKDKMPTKIGSRAEISYPAIGSIVTIVPTHVVNVELFYAQIPAQNELHMVTLKEIVLKMNSPEIKGSYIQYKQPPVELELVLGLYTDNQWYRAKVLNVMDDETIKIFYLDFGNCQVLPLHKIRQWDERFDYFPFQAIDCKLDNVVKIKEFHCEAIEEFKSLILNKTITAKIINNIDHLYVTLMDDDGFDIGENLCAKNYANFKHANKPFSYKNQLLPG